MSSDREISVNNTSKRPTNKCEKCGNINPHSHLWKFYIYHYNQWSELFSKFGGLNLDILRAEIEVDRNLSLYGVHLALLGFYICVEYRGRD